MGRSFFIVPLAVVVGCLPGQLAPKTTPAAASVSDSPSAEIALKARSVFSDSAMYVARCEPTRANEDWRQVCIPKDQAMRIR